MSDTQNSEIKPAKEEQSVHETPANKIVERDAEAGLAKEARPSARLLPMWILIAAVIVVGVAWALSDRYFGTSEMDESDVPLVTAEKAPIKVKPKKPGGIDVPDRDKYVYKSLTGEEPDAEELLPPPEEPMEVTSAVADEGVDALEAAEIDYECFYVMASTGGYEAVDVARTEERLGWKAAIRFAADL